jgi:hypothetical protein
VRETAQQAADTSRQILVLVESDRRLIEQLGRPASSVLRVHQHLQRKPTITIPATAQQLSLSVPAVAKALHHMANLGMVRETTGKQRHHLFTYHRYLAILNEGVQKCTDSPRYHVNNLEENGRFSSIIVFWELRNRTG